MFDERAFIARVEAAGPDEFARLLARPGPEEERALRAHLGEERYQRLHAMAMRRGVRSTRRASAGNVVVIHGIMGGELSTRAAGDPGGGGGDHVWARLLSLVRGRVARLRLAEDGRSDFDAAVAVEATGIMKRSYGEILLALADRWAVRAFWFDWRKDLTLAGNELAAKITAWFGAEPEKPVHLVAHSMGGLVARTFIMDHAAQWERMGGRLVMLGTPNYGSYAIPQVITGLEGLVRKLALVDLSHDVGDLLPVFNSFVGSYQMLPSPQRLAELKVDGDWMYDATSYAPVAVPQRHLDAARAHHAALHAHHAARARMLYVAGYNQPTFDGVAKARAGDRSAYTVTYRGDGRVPHDLGRLDGVRTYYVEEGHGDLPCNEAVLGAVEDLLARGATDALPARLPEGARVRGAATVDADARARLWAGQDAELERLGALAQRAQSRGADPVSAVQVAPIEREVEERRVQGFLATPGAARRRAQPPLAAAPAARIRLRLAHGDIDKTDALPAAELPVDAI